MMWLLLPLYPQVTVMWLLLPGRAPLYPQVSVMRQSTTLSTGKCDVAAVTTLSTGKCDVAAATWKN